MPQNYHNNLEKDGRVSIAKKIILIQVFIWIYFIVFVFKNKKW